MLFAGATSGTFAETNEFIVNDDLFLGTRDAAVDLTDLLLNDYCAVKKRSISLVSFGKPKKGKNDAKTKTYQPSSGFMGRDTFTYEATDGITTNTATVEVIISLPVDETAWADILLGPSKKPIVELAYPIAKNKKQIQTQTLFQGVATFGGNARALATYSPELADFVILQEEIKEKEDQGPFDMELARIRMAAAMGVGTAGSGRVLTMGNVAWFKEMTVDMVSKDQVFIKNALAWLGDKSSLRIATSLPNIQTALQKKSSALGIDSSVSVVGRGKATYADLASHADVFIGPVSAALSRDDVDGLIDFVLEGGGVLTGETLHPKEVERFYGYHLDPIHHPERLRWTENQNHLLRRAGLAIGGLSVGDRFNGYAAMTNANGKKSSRYFVPTIPIQWSSTHSSISKVIKTYNKTSPSKTSRYEEASYIASHLAILSEALPLDDTLRAVMTHELKSMSTLR